MSASLSITEEGWMVVLWDKYVLRHRTERAGTAAPCYRFDRAENLLTVVTNLDHPFVSSWPPTECGWLYTAHLADATSRAFAWEKQSILDHTALKSVLLEEFPSLFGLREAPSPAVAPVRDARAGKRSRGKRSRGSNGASKR